MTDRRDRPNSIPWPPILDVLTLLVAGALHKTVPLPLVAPDTLGPLIGWALAAIGIGFGVAAIFRFRAVGTPVNPTGQAQALSDGGVYGLTRNPMYFGTLVLFAGLALALGVTWLLVLLPLLAFGLLKLAIEREEAYLERRFGTDYLAYKARVRRWI